MLISLLTVKKLKKKELILIEILTVLLEQYLKQHNLVESHIEDNFLFHKNNLKL